MDASDPTLIAEEAGDILFMLLFLIQLYEEKGKLSLEEVLDNIRRKMIFRHPHVFAHTAVNSVDEVKANWQKLKLKEGKPRKGLLEGIPKSMPALSMADTITKKAAEVGFDWDGAVGVIAKIKEETEELETVLEQGTDLNREEELGDLFFSLVNLSRHLDIDPERALRKTCDKFRKRFGYIEEYLTARGKELKQTPLHEMEQLWQESKTRPDRIKK